MQGSKQPGAREGGVHGSGDCGTCHDCWGTTMHAVVATDVYKAVGGMVVHVGMVTNLYMAAGEEKGRGGRVTRASSSDSRLSRDAAPPLLAPAAAPAPVPRALTPPPRGDPTWAQGVCRNILSSHDLGGRSVNEASAQLVEALLGCTNVFDEFEASKEQVSKLEKHAEELVGAIPAYMESE
nr:hypothetical protein Iba_chr12aCG19980 [Ipomoea batatas]